IHKTSFIGIVVLSILDRYTMHLYFMTTYYILILCLTIKIFPLT
ncbi:hypothetical protein, partial [Plasmodium yoelii yoelii]